MAKKVDSELLSSCALMLSVAEEEWAKGKIAAAAKKANCVMALGKEVPYHAAADALWKRCAAKA